MKKSVKILLIVFGCIIMLGILAFLFLYWFAHGITVNRSTNDLNKYEQYLTVDEERYQGKKVLPALEDCGAYLSGTVSMRNNNGIFSFRSHALFLNYDALEYDKQCNVINERYCFKTEGNESFQDVDAELYGFSILWIMLFHGIILKNTALPSKFRFLTRFLENGNCGVEIFLFLSGICFLT